LLADRGLKLDGVVELKVDEGILLQRIERRVAEMTARGENVRADDNPEVLKGRLAAYRAQTAPLAGYYDAKSMLKGVDGMAAIDEVTAAIDGVLDPAKGGDEPKAVKRSTGQARGVKKPVKKRTKKRAKKGLKKRLKKPRRAKKARSAARKAGARRKGPVGRKSRKNKAGLRKNRTRRG
jgi:adenylate kinase